MIYYIKYILYYIILYHIIVYHIIFLFYFILYYITLDYIIYYILYYPSGQGESILSSFFKCSFLPLFLSSFLSFFFFSDPLGVRFTSHLNPFPGHQPGKPFRGHAFSKPIFYVNFRIDS